MVCLFGACLAVSRRPGRQIAGLLCLLPLLWALPAGAEQRVEVQDRPQLMAALKAARGGETLVLGAGDYGRLALPLNGAPSYERPVTLQSERPFAARFDKIELRGARNLAFRDLDIGGGMSIRDRSRDISITGVQISGVLYLRDLTGFTLERTTIRGDQYALIMNSVQDFRVRGNLLMGAWEDLMRITGNSSRGLMEYNELLDVAAAPKVHPDMLQIFGLPGITPHDLVIRRNLIWDDPTTGRPGSMAQGIFMTDSRSDQGYRNITIEENLIAVQSPNSIRVAGATQNVVIRNNSLMPSIGDGGAMLRLGTGGPTAPGAALVANNVVKLVNDDTKNGVFRDNYVYGRNARLEALFAGRGGSRWQDYVPVSGSAVDFGSGLGAEAWLKELLDRQTPQKVGGPRRAGAPLPAGE